MKRLVILALLAAAPAAAQSRDTLTLDAALDAALGRSPALAAAQAGVGAARAGRTEARAAWLPSVTTAGSVVRFEEPMVVAPLHGFDPRTPPEFDRTLSQGRLSVGWTLFDGGARSARTAAAGARVESASAGSADARSAATLSVIEVYLRVLGARDAAAAQRTRDDQLTAETARAARLVAEGAAPRLELLRAEAELEAVRAEGISTATALRVAEADLARSMGTSPEAVARAALVEMRPVAVASAAVDSAAADPAPDHPLLRQARGRAAAARAVVREARAAWLPRVQGTGAMVEYGAGVGDFVGEWQAGLQLEWALFAGGARGARVDQASAEAARAVAEEQAAAETVARMIDQARAGADDAQARWLALGSAVARYEELVRVESLALAEGENVQADYLRALAALHMARVGQADAKRATVLARARLARAEGRLDGAWVRTRLEMER